MLSYYNVSAKIKVEAAETQLSPCSFLVAPTMKVAPASRDRYMIHCTR